MSNPDFSLGHALAYVKLNSQSLSKLSLLSLSDQDIVNRLSKRVDEFRKTEGDIDKYLSLPEHACNTQNFFLCDNEDFFIMRLIVFPEEKKKSKLCWNLTRHLNDCFNCFIEFTEVMRDYYHKINELSSQELECPNP